MLVGSFGCHQLAASAPAAAIVAALAAPERLVNSPTFGGGCQIDRLKPLMLHLRCLLLLQDSNLRPVVVAAVAVVGM